MPCLQSLGIAKYAFVGVWVSETPLARHGMIIVILFWRGIRSTVFSSARTSLWLVGMSFGSMIVFKPTFSEASYSMLFDFNFVKCVTSHKAIIPQRLWAECSSRVVMGVNPWLFCRYRIVYRCYCTTKFTIKIWFLGRRVTVYDTLPSTFFTMVIPTSLLNHWRVRGRNWQHRCDRLSVIDWSMALSQTAYLEHWWGQSAAVGAIFVFWRPYQGP